MFGRRACAQTWYNTIPELQSINQNSNPKPGMIKLFCNYNF